MNISGVLVRAKPGSINNVTRSLNKLKGVEVHGNNKDGRMVVTVEDSTNNQLADRLIEINNVPGVLSASMIYHQFNDNE